MCCCCVKGKPHSAALISCSGATGSAEMPFFRFGKSKAKYKSSSMGSLYKDYAGGGDVNHQERQILPPATTVNETLKSQNEVLQQENNLLKLKVEVLLDMLAQKTAEAELQESDILKMKNILANS